MSYCICRVQKIKSSSEVKGLEIHHHRDREKSYSNPDIDYEKTNLNYTIVNENGKNYNTLIDERLKKGYTGKKTIRKDAIKLCECLFTSDGEFFNNKSPEQIKDYFRECYSFACGKFGTNNIISATVHLDEATPHMHLDFVPLTLDGRLSAKDVIGGRTSLQRLQDEFFLEVGKNFGLERGERTDFENNKPAKHKSMGQLKKDTQNELVALNKQIEDAQNLLNDLDGKILSKQEINKIEGKKSLTGALKNVTYEEYLSLKKTASQIEVLNQDKKKLQTKNKDLTTKVNKLENKVNMTSEILKSKGIELDLDKEIKDLKKIRNSPTKEVEEKKKEEPKKARFSLDDLNSDKFAPRSQQTENGLKRKKHQELEL